MTSVLSRHADFCHRAKVEADEGQVGSMSPKAKPVEVGVRGRVAGATREANQS